MAEEKSMRISQVARKLNVGRHTIIDFLAEKGFEVDSNPNSKISAEQLAMLSKEFAESAHDKEEASSLTIGTKLDSDGAVESSESKKEEEEESVLIKNVSAESPAAKETFEEEQKAPEKVQEKVEAKVEAAPVEKVEKVETERLQGIKVLGKIELNKPKKQEPKVEPVLEKEEKKEQVQEKVEAPVVEKAPEVPKVEAPAPKEPVKEVVEDELIEAKADKLKGLKVIGKIVLPSAKEKPVASSDERKEKKKRPRKRIPNTNKGGVRKDTRNSKFVKEEPSDKEIQDKIKATLAKLSTSGKKGGGAKYRREKRTAYAEAEEVKALQEQEDSKILKVAEFVSANDMASLMDISVNDVISTCLSLGMFVSINQRLDAEAITIIADEFGYNVEFISADEEADIIEEEEPDELMSERAPIVTIMGHVDHGKTSLLDYIRKSKITDQEAGGITQHIGAYDVMTASGHKIAFLDTPGHEAFTAMRARGASVTDIVIIVVAADDDVMPQTKEAINHAQVAGVPIVIAINKIDKPAANPEKVKESLSKINILVEDWGGKYQCQEISAKSGVGIDDLLEKVLLEAELLELKANPNKKASGTVIEASLDKGRGYVATILVQNGTMQVGDIIVAGAHHGRVKAMFDHKATKLDSAGPATPVLLLGLDGAPQAGDKFNVMETDREAREIASKRGQILREQNIRTKKHITLDEIGRRLAIGSFKELNVIVKGDVDGSVEALSDSLLKLSTEEVQVNIIHKGVGQISESDVLLATASDAVIVGFQVRPSGAAKKIAETEELEIRLYSVIYDAINDVKDAMEGMLDPGVEEVINGNVEVREVFKISKVGTVAGCMVTEGFVKKSLPIRLIRDGIVVYSGDLGQLKRFKEDVGEVKSGYECGISIRGFNDIKEGDVIESYEEKEVKRKLK